MFCSKCGKPVNDTDRFCEFCGSRITAFTEPVIETETQALTDNVIETVDIQVENPTEVPAEAVLQTEVQPDNSVGKSKRKLIVVLSVCAAAVAAVAVFTAAFWGYIENFFAKSFSSPDNYYHYVEKKNIQDFPQTLGSAVGNFKSTANNANEGGVKSEISLQLGDIIIDALAKEAGVDKSQISWASNIGISSDFSSKDGASSGDIAFLINNKPVLNMELVYNSENYCYYLRLPDLNEDYLLVDMSEFADDFDPAETEKICAALPDEETVAEIINRYFTIVINGIDNVQQKNVKVEANGVSQNCVELTVTVDETTIKNVLEAVLTELKNDEEIKSIIKEVALAADVDEDDFEDSYEDFIDEIKDNIDSLDELDSELEDFCFDMITWVDGKGEVIGRRFEFDGLNGDIYYLSTRDGSDIGFEAVCVIDDEGFEVFGNGTYERGKMSGEIEVFGIGMYRKDKLSLINIEFKDYEVSLFGDNELNGIFTITVSDEFADIIAKEAGNKKIAEYLKKGKIVLSVAVADDTGSFEMTVMYDSELVASLKINTEETDAKDFTVPEKAVDMSDYDEFADYCDDMSVGKFKSNLIDAGVPEELVDYLFSDIDIEDNNSNALTLSVDYT